MDNKLTVSDVVCLGAALVAAALFLKVLTNEQQQQQDECKDGRCPPRVDVRLPRVDVRVESAPVGTLIGTQLVVPDSLRIDNWAPYGFGSCVHASTATLLHYQGQHELAEWWIANYNSGEYEDRLIRRLEAAGLRYAWTTDGDMEFLEWAIRNRLGAGIFYFPSHAINVFGIDENFVYLLDNNRNSDYIAVARKEFEHRWKNEFGGFSWTIVGTPPPPTPVW